MQIKLSISPSHSILTPVPALTLSRQAPGRVATGKPIFKSLDPEKKSLRKRDSNPGPSALEADTLPLRQRGRFPHRHIDIPSIMKRYHRRRMCNHTSPRRSPTMVTLHDTRFVECRWWNDGWDCEDCRHLTVIGLHGHRPLLYSQGKHGVHIQDW